MHLWSAGGSIKSGYLASAVLQDKRKYFDNARIKRGGLDPPESGWAWTASTNRV